MIAWFFYVLAGCAPIQPQGPYTGEFAIQACQQAEREARDAGHQTIACEAVILDE